MIYRSMFYLNFQPFRCSSTDRCDNNIKKKQKTDQHSDTSNNRHRTCCAVPPGSCWWGQLPPGEIEPSLNKTATTIGLSGWHLCNEALIRDVQGLREFLRSSGYDLLLPFLDQGIFGTCLYSSRFASQIPNRPWHYQRISRALLEPARLQSCLTMSWPLFGPPLQEQPPSSRTAWPMDVFFQAGNPGTQSEAPTGRRFLNFPHRLWITWAQEVVSFECCKYRGQIKQSTTSMQCQTGQHHILCIYTVYIYI